MLSESSSLYNNFDSVLWNKVWNAGNRRARRPRTWSKHSGRIRGRSSTLNGTRGRQDGLVLRIGLPRRSLLNLTHPIRCSHLCVHSYAAPSVHKGSVVPSVVSVQVFQLHPRQQPRIVHGGVVGDNNNIICSIVASSICDTCK